MTLFLGLVVLVFQNCSTQPAVVFSNASKAKINSEENGDGYLGKPPPGDFVRSHIDFSCQASNPLTQNIQGLLAVGDLSAIMTDDNCQNYSYVIAIDSPNLDYVPYNRDYLGWNSAIYEKKEIFQSQADSAVDLFCRQSDASQGLDVVVKINERQEAFAQIYSGTQSGGVWSSRRVPSFSVQRTLTGNSALYQTADFDLSVDITNSTQMLFSAHLNALIDGTSINRNLDCRRMRVDPVIANSQQGLLALWQMNSSLVDVSGFANNATAFDPTNTLLFQPGIYDTALSLDGNTTTRVQVAPSVSLNNLSQMSLSAWVWPLAGGGGLIAKSTDVGPLTQGWRLYIGAGTTRLGFESAYTGNRLSVVSLSGAVVLNSWNHVVVTWNGSNLVSGVNFYVNGVLVGLGTSFDATGSRLDDAVMPVLLGDFPDDASTHLRGRLDQVSVWNRVLSPVEVQQLFTTGSPAP